MLLKVRILAVQSLTITECFNEISGLLTDGVLQFTALSVNLSALCSSHG